MKKIAAAQTAAAHSCGPVCFGFCPSPRLISNGIRALSAGVQRGFV